MYGYWPAAQPNSTATTARAAEIRAAAYRARASSTSVAAPASADIAINGAPRCVSPWNRSGASCCNTNTPPSATTPATIALPSARRRKARTSSGRSRRSASAVEVHGREEGAHDHRHDPAEHRRGVQPARATRRRSARPPGPDPTRCRPPRRPSMNGVSTDDDAKVDAEQSPQRQRLRRLAERERRAPQDDADRGQRERHVQRRHDRRERRGERGPQRDEHEDQPDVVRFPHRARSTPRSTRAARARVRRRPRRDPRTPRRNRRPRAARTSAMPDEHDRRAHVGELSRVVTLVGHDASSSGSGARMSRRNTIDREQPHERVHHEQQVVPEPDVRRVA